VLKIITFYILHSYVLFKNTDMHHLTTGKCYEKCVVRPFRRCADAYLHKPRECSVAYYTPRLYARAYCC